MMYAIHRFFRIAVCAVFAVVLQMVGSGEAVADDLAVLSDEFSNAATLQNWTDIVEEEGWVV